MDKTKKSIAGQLFWLIFNLILSIRTQNKFDLRYGTIALSQL